MSMVTGPGASWRLIGDKGRGALVTIRRDGRPQLSSVDYLADEAAGLIRISSTADRAKVHNVRRDPRLSLYVSDGGSYVVAEGTGSLSAVSASRDDAAVDELIDVYRGIAGEHSDWDDYRRAMVADHRLVIRLQVDRVYGMG